MRHFKSVTRKSRLFHILTCRVQLNCEFESVNVWIQTPHFQKSKSKSGFLSSPFYSITHNPSCPQNQNQRIEITQNDIIKTQELNPSLKDNLTLTRLSRLLNPEPTKSILIRYHHKNQSCCNIYPFETATPH